MHSFRREYVYSTLQSFQCYLSYETRTRPFLQREPPCWSDFTSSHISTQGTSGSLSL